MSTPEADEEWRKYVGFEPNSSHEDRVCRLKRRRHAEAVYLMSAEAWLSVCGDYNPEELRKAQHSVARMQARVKRLDKLITLTEERAETELIARLLPD